MGFFGEGDDVSISINGNSEGLQGAVHGAEAAMRSLSDTVDSSNNSFTGYRFTMQSLGNDILDNLGGFGATVITLNSLLGVFGEIGGAITTVVGDVGSFVENLAQVAASDAWQALQFGADQVERLGQAMFDLNNQTEKNVTNWTYLFGGPNNGGSQAASDLAAWTQQFSMQIPYTRQDLMSAITALGAAPGATVSSIEQELPLLANVASTQGTPGLTLAWAARAALRASEGGKGSGASMVMLMRDLNLNRQELEQYGYSDTDSSTFWPALENYEKAKGSYGAAKDISTKTFWGAESSFQDRIQNFLLSAGGTNVAGQVQKGSFFGNLKDDLVGVSDWMDSHQSDLTKLADIVSNLYGAGVEAGTNAFTAFVDTLHSTGIDTTVEKDLADFAHWLAEPSTQEGARELGNMVGQLTGIAGTDLRGIFGSLWEGLTSSGVGQTLLQDVKDATQWLADPANQQELQQMGFILGQGVGVSVQSIAISLQDAGTYAQEFIQRLTPEDILGIAAAFGYLAFWIETMTNYVGMLSLVMIDLGHVMNDLANHDYASLGLDYIQLQGDQVNFLRQEQQAWNQNVNQSADMNQLFLQWKQQQQAAETKPTAVSVSASHLTHAENIASQSDAVASSGHIAHGEHAAFSGAHHAAHHASMTENFAAGMVGDLSHMTRAGQQVVGQFGAALVQAASGQMSVFGQQVASHIALAIEQKISEEFRLQNQQDTLAYQMPGGYGRFAGGGGGKNPW